LLVLSRKCTNLAANVLEMCKCCFAKSQPD
jgi:hypothetical protein